MNKRSNRSALTVIAFYLGQYHPIPENDEFWGPGFTEWHNVAKARPLFPGHEQPKLPGKFGFYDLRNPETLTAQILYSREIGVDAFCHWHYWFAGKRVLHRPLDAMIELGMPQHQFMLGWANETWSGIWHGASHRILIQQTYDRNELVEHARLITRYLGSGQYLQIDGRFPFVVYKPKQIPNAAEYLGELKRLVQQFSGSELYLIGNWTPGKTGSFAAPANCGLDAAVVTPVAALFTKPFLQLAYSAFWQTARKLRLGPEVRSYKQTITTLRKALSTISGVAHASVVTDWDNTPRSGRRGLVLRGYTESAFRAAVRDAISLELANTTPLLFVKSWNEWAECNVLEPRFDEKWSAGNVLKEVLAEFALDQHPIQETLHEVLSD